MSISLHNIIIGIDNCLCNSGLGAIPYNQTSTSDTKSVEVWIPNDNVQNFLNVLRTESRRSNVAMPHPQDVLAGIDLHNHHTLAVTEYSFKLKELPRLLQLLESGLEHRNQYPFMINDEAPSTDSSQTDVAL